MLAAVPLLMMTSTTRTIVLVVTVHAGDGERQPGSGTGIQGLRGAQEAKLRGYDAEVRLILTEQPIPRGLA
jgi:hypothetical protein